jgi:hypothetical protein
MKTIVDLILRMALENRSWGYTRIRGALANLEYQIGRGTIAKVLREHGIEPAPERDRHTRWSTFLKAHWECLAATDFLSVEVYTVKGPLNAIIRASQTNSYGPPLSSRHLSRCIGASASVECSTITTAQPPERRRSSFWTVRARRSRTGLVER